MGSRHKQPHSMNTGVSLDDQQHRHYSPSTARCASYWWKQVRGAMGSWLAVAGVRIWYFCIEFGLRGTTHCLARRQTSAMQGAIRLCPINEREAVLDRPRIALLLTPRFTANHGLSRVISLHPRRTTDSSRGRQNLHTPLPTDI